jgi:hypothetical protein
VIRPQQSAIRRRNLWLLLQQPVIQARLLVILLQLRSSRRTAMSTTFSYSRINSCNFFLIALHIC